MTAGPTVDDPAFTSETGRLALRVEYDGQPFCGWQKQPHAPSVQASLESALSRVADHPVTVVSAGRTDTGVHATAQVIHFDTSSTRPEHGWVLGANSNLPAGVSVLSAHPTGDGFHARYSASARAYTYLFLARRSRPAILRGRVGWHHAPLDADRMAEAAQPLVGEHDFSAFRAAACQAAHAVRDLRSLRVRDEGGLVRIDVEANAFLHHMVRNLAGTLLRVGTGERPVSWPAELLASGDRTQAGMTAPPEGLYLTRVAYPARYGVPDGARAPFFA